MPLELVVPRNWERGFLGLQGDSCVSGSMSVRFISVARVLFNGVHTWLVFILPSWLNVNADPMATRSFIGCSKIASSSCGENSSSAFCRTAPHIRVELGAIQWTEETIGLLV
jgi:hypothetical protein